METPLEERVLIYLGPSLDIDTAKHLAPNGIFRPPVRHSDLISDIPIYDPTHVIIIDGEFGANLSVWHKELVYALQVPTIKGIYGAASMGALRAAELADYGMVGIGKIFWLYYEGVLEKDDEVAVLFHKTPKGEYVCDTTALADVRCMLLDAEEDDPRVQKYFEIIEAKHWTERVAKIRPEHSQKRKDAIEALSRFREYHPFTYSVKPTVQDISVLSMAQMERDRKVQVEGQMIPMQHIDSFFITHCPDYHQAVWDSQNRALAIVLCDLLGVGVSAEEIQWEESRQAVRMGIETFNGLQDWLKANAMSGIDYQLMVIENARISKLQSSYSTTMVLRRRTRTLLSYLRTHGFFEDWLKGCAEQEKLVTDSEGNDLVGLEPTFDLPAMIREHCARQGIVIDGSYSDYISENGFGTAPELYVALARSKLASERSGKLAS